MQEIFTNVIIADINGRVEVYNKREDIRSSLIKM